MGGWTQLSGGGSKAEQRSREAYSRCSEAPAFRRPPGTAFAWRFCPPHRRPLHFQLLVTSGVRVTLAVTLKSVQRTPVKSDQGPPPQCSERHHSIPPGPAPRLWDSLPLQQPPSQSPSSGSSSLGTSYTQAEIVHPVPQPLPITGQHVCWALPANIALSQEESNVSTALHPRKVAFSPRFSHCPPHAHSPCATSFLVPAGVTAQSPVTFHKGTPSFCTVFLSLCSCPAF